MGSAPPPNVACVAGCGDLQRVVAVHRIHLDRSGQRIVVSRISRIHHRLQHRVELIQRVLVVPRGT